MNKKIVYGALWIIGCWLTGCTILFTTSIYTRWFDNTTICNTIPTAILWSKATKNNGSTIDITNKQTNSCNIDPISLYVQNSIPIKIWLPIDTAKKAPVILFSHGYALDCSWYSFIINDLVAHGYIVVGIDHPHIARSVTMPNGTKIPYQKPTFIDEQNKHTKICMALDQYILNIESVYQQIAQWNNQKEHVLYNRLAIDCCIVMGHSLGGAASIAYGSYNKNISAAISLDGFYTPWNEQKTNNIPLLYLSAEPQSTHQKERLAAVQKQALKQPITIHTINGADHNAFCDAILWNKAKRWWYATIMPVGNIHSNTDIELIQKHIHTFCEQVNISIQKK